MARRGRVVGSGGRRPGTSPDGSSESVLPLNVFHVLEEEYVALHGALPATYPGFDFAPDQIVADKATLIPEDLASASAGRSGATACGRYLAGLLGREWTEARLRALSLPELVALLNDLLKRSDLYDGWPSTGTALRGETQEYIRLYFDVMSEKLSGEDLVRFNRLLLEDAYPTALRRLNNVRLEAIVQRIHATPTAALCLSGGGIRSGTFSLGVLQGLARRGLLSQMHYLSTVSGGGYIGSWLTAWCHRHVERLKGVIGELTKTTGPRLEPEAEPLRQLREYASFTAPRPSLTSADVWSFVAIYLRNLLINWAALIPLLIAVLLVPRIVTTLFYARYVVSGAAQHPHAPAAETSELGLVFYGLLAAGFVLSVLSVLYVTINRPSRADLLVPRSWWRRHRGQGDFLRYALLPSVLAGLCLSTFWAWARAGNPPAPPDVLARPVAWAMICPLWLVLIVLAVAVYAVAILIAAVILRSWPRWADWVAAAFTGGGGGLLTWLFLRTAFAAPVPPPGYVVTTGAWYATLAVPAYLMILFGGIIAFVAATSKRRAATWGKTWFSIEDEDREWLGRCGGWLFLTAAGWAALSGLVLFGPLVLLMSPKILSGLGGISGLAAALGGKSALTPATDKNASARGWQALLFDHLLTIAAVVFLALFIAAVSLFSSWAVASVVDAQYRPASQLLRWPSYAGGAVASQSEEVVPAAWTALTMRGQLAILYFSPVCRVAALAVVLAGLGLLAGWVINLNKFSLHAAYRSRIIRAFLGASRPADERVPNPFTGFDPQDNIQMHELRPGLLREASFKPGGLVALADKLARAQARDGNDVLSTQLVHALSSITNGMLHRHSPGHPLSQSLKRNLLEDLNRQLDGTPGLLDIKAFAELASHEPAREIVRVVTEGRAVAKPPAQSDVLTNAALAQKLPAHGRSNALLVLNRAVLSSVYKDELNPLDWPPPPYSLLHVVGTALNLVGGKRLAWQQRRAESFTISPLHCGSLFRGYRRSRQYGGTDGVSLGTAATISGAAVSSNMGYHSSSAAVTFVLTLFNARLGWWLGNPGVAGDDRSLSRFSEPPYRRAFPRMSLAPLVMEAFGLTDDTSRYVLLSDGGHFDNLGLYEMVLRRCRLIVAVDASQDENAAFDDLGATVRKIRIDLGVEIVFDNGLAIFKRDSQEIKDGKGRYCAVATIRYPEESAPAGVLVYIKPTILGREPRDVLQYAAANPDFPHQTTLDQFFDESQFESYRRLGEWAIEAVCGPPGPDMTFEEFVRCARNPAGPSGGPTASLPAGFWSQRRPEA